MDRMLTNEYQCIKAGFTRDNYKLCCYVYILMVVVSFECVHVNSNFLSHDSLLLI